MNDQQKDIIDNIVIDVAKKENVTNPKIVYNTNTAKNGYIGEIVKIAVTGTNKKLYLVAKCSNSQGGFWEKMSAHELFIREIEVYEEIKPLFKKLQHNYKAKHPFDKLARCYGSEKSPRNEVLVMEDLIKAGFELGNSLKPLEVQNIEFVLKEYAKLHAVSLAYKYHEPAKYLDLMSTKYSIMGMFSKVDAGILIKSCVENAKTCFEPNENLGKAYNKMFDNYDEHYAKFSKIDEFSVIYHGDCWCNNFMFKFEGKNVVDVRFLDFQLSAAGSLAYDLSYFIMANSPKVDVDSINHYLNLYHKQLTERLKEMGCPAEKIFPHATFMNQWKNYSVTGLIMAVTALKFATAAVDEKPDIVNSDFTEAVNFEGQNYDEYKRRVRGIVKYYYDAGLI